MRRTRKRPKKPCQHPSHRTAAGKPVGQLETNAEQLGFFDALPEDAQRTLLVASLDQPEQVRQQFQEMLAAWARGDVNAIARTFNDDMIGLKGIAKRAVFVLDKDGVVRHREVLDDARNEPDYGKVYSTLAAI